MARLHIDNVIIKNKGAIIAAIVTAIFTGTAIFMTCIEEYDLLWCWPIIIACTAMLILLGVFNLNVDESINDLLDVQNGSISMSIISGVITFIGQMVYYGAYYPGGFNLDAYGQWDQVHGNMQWDNWHPIITSFIYWILTRIQDDLGFCILVQIIIFTFSFVCLIYQMSKIGVKSWVLIAISVITAVNPAIGTNNVCLIKDVYFSIAVLWSVIITIRIVTSKGEWLNSNKRHCVYLILTLAFIVMVRHNGIIYMIPLCLSIIVIYRNTWKRVVIGFIVALLIAIFVETGFLGMISVRKHSNVDAEMVGIPMAAMVNSYINDYDEVPDEVRELLEKIADKDTWSDMYYLGEWDSCRWDVDGDEIIKDLGALNVWKLFIKTARACPETTYYSIAENTRIVWQLVGEVYWNPYVYIEYPNIYGIHEEHNLVCENIVNRILWISYQVPISSFVWNTGVLIILLLGAGILAIVSGKRSTYILLIPAFCYMAGIILLLCGPNFRYFYFEQVIFLPCLALMMEGIRKRKS